MKKETKTKIKALIKEKFEKKVDSYNPETNFMPFTEALLSSRGRAIYSFGISISTTIGMSMHEQIAKIIAEEEGGFFAETQHPIDGNIDYNTEEFINNLHKDLSEKKISPSYSAHLEEIKNKVKKINNEDINDKYPDRIADIFLMKEKKEYYFDITSPKPNKKEFGTMKKKLLMKYLYLVQLRQVTLFMQ